MVVSELFLLFAILLNKRLILTYDEETSSANQHSTKEAWRGGLETHHSAAKLQYSFGMSKKKKEVFRYTTCLFMPLWAHDIGLMARKHASDEVKHNVLVSKTQFLLHQVHALDESFL